MDPSDACEKLRTALKVLGGFKLHYIAYKTLSASECHNHPWRFQSSVVFGRLDKFMQRCADMLELQNTCLQVTARMLWHDGTTAKAATGHCEMPAQPVQACMEQRSAVSLLAASSLNHSVSCAQYVV